jgi:hypothetical protein
MGETARGLTEEGPLLLTCLKSEGDVGLKKIFSARGGGGGGVSKTLRPWGAARPAHNPAGMIPNDEGVREKSNEGIVRGTAVPVPCIIESGECEGGAALPAAFQCY